MLIESNPVWGRAMENLMVERENIEEEEVKTTGVLIKKGLKTRNDNEVILTMPRNRGK